MRKLVVCGDSFASASVLTPGKHYSEIIADRMGYELVSLARGGMSNLGICLQIEYAIKMQADFVIVSFTDSGRIEIPFKKGKFNFVTNDDLHSVDHALFGNSIHRGYDQLRGLENIVYDHKKYLSSSNKFLNQNPTMRSDNVSSLMWGEYYAVTKNQKTAMQYYLTELFDSEWKAQVDRWGLMCCLRELLDSNIPFISINGNGMWITDSWLPEKNQIGFDWQEFTYASRDPLFVDPGYHTDEPAQVKIADIFYDKVMQVLQ